LPTAQPPVTVAAQPAALSTAAPAGTAPAAGSSSPPARELEERATAGQRAQEAERLAAQEAERRAAQEAQQRAQGQVNALLGQAEAALAAQGYDAAIEGFNRVLALDPQNARALQGRSGAIAARAIAQAARANPAAPAAPGHAFVAGRTVPHAAEGESRPVPEGFSDTPGVTVKRGSQGAELPGKILFEVEPEAVAANTSYNVRIYLLNEGNAPIQIRDMVVGTELNKRMARGPLPPLAREVGPRQKALLREISGTWKQDTASWSMEVLLRTERGEAYENRLTWK
jgi:hypothetical protein